MAIDLDQAQLAMEQAEQGTEQFGPNLARSVEQEAQQAWTPAMKEASGVLGRQLEGFLPGVFKIPYTGLQAGTTAADTSPQAKLAAMGQGFGELSGGIGRAASYTDMLGANYRSALDKSMKLQQMGYQQAADKYNRAAQRYQMAWQAAENERNRAAARAGQAMPDWMGLTRTEIENIPRERLTETIGSAADTWRSALAGMPFAGRRGGSAQQQSYSPAKQKAMSAMKQAMGRFNLG